MNWARLGLTVMLAACGDGTRSGADGDAADGIDAAPDTEPDVVPDTEPDAAPDTALGDSAPADGDTRAPGTVAGTPLEGLAIAWPDALELCSQWYEGADLAEEKAHKVRILMPPQTRPSLDEVDFAGARLEGLDVQRGPDAAERFRPPAVRELTTLTEWQLSSGALTAVIAHRLADGSGVIVEQWTVSRASGDASPIRVTPESRDVSFIYQAPGSERTVRLERCGGPPEYEDAVSVVVGTADGGRTWAALLRFWRTLPNDEGVQEGSYPVTLVGHRLVTSDAPWWFSDASGHWAQTYVAQHHNFDDASEVDFTRDLGQWHTVFREPDPLATPVMRVNLAGVLGFSEASMTLERWGANGPTSQTLAVDARAFPRVDERALQRELPCEGGQVLAAGGSDHLFQMKLCPRGAAWDLVGLVPVLWASEPSRAGSRLGQEAVTALADGWAVSVGSATLVIKPQPEGVYNTELLDAGGELISGLYGAAYALGPWPAAREETLTGESEDGAVAFELHRRWAGFGVGKSQLWAPVRFVLTFGGASHQVEAWDRLAYENTHHNWNDSLEAVSDEGNVLRWSTDFMNGVPNLVSASGPDGTELLPPTKLGRSD